MRKNKSRLFFRAITANTEKVQPVIQNFKIGILLDLSFHFIQAFQVRIDNLFAPDADDVRMRRRPVSIIAVASIREPQF
jgi:hypothetical protein